jgi:phosphate transport system substrate-binding protein
MLKLKYRALLAASVAIVGVTAGSSGAFAAAGDIWGGGAGVVAPYWRQTLDCFALPTQLIIKGTPPTFVTETPFDYLGFGVNLIQPQDCSTQHFVSNLTAYYISSSSGNGILTQFSHDPTLWGHIDQAQTLYAPEVFYNLSETPLTSVDDGIWNNGGTETQGSSHVVVVAFGQTAGQGQYGNPLQLYGPLIQFPITVDPLAIAYDPAYEKVLNQDNSVTTYHFNIHYPRTDHSGGLRLDATTYCKIFNGQITNWNDPALKALNGNKSLEDPSDPTPAGSWSVPLQIDGRVDSGGTTSTLTRHLSNVCASLSGNNYITGTSTLPAALQGPVYNSANPNYPAVSGETLGKFTLATQNQGVAQYTAFTAVPNGTNGNNGANSIIQGRVTYVGVDYVLPYVLNTGSNTYNLNSATLKNALAQWEAPSPAAALKPFSAILPPQSDAQGNYVAGNTANGLRANPQDWVQGPAPTSLLANPNVSGSYPMVGTANFLGYTCYKSKTVTTTFTKLFSYTQNHHIETDPKSGILAEAGLSPLPFAWLHAEQTTFVNNVSGLGLNFNTAGAPGLCSVSGIVGG